jgi:hypothetical protein
MELRAELYDSGFAAERRLGTPIRWWNDGIHEAAVVADS